MSLRPRMFEIAWSLKAQGMQPGRWRCSPDMGDELSRLGLMVAVADHGPRDALTRTYELQAPWGDWPARTRLIAPPAAIDGVPVVVDESLPPNSLLLEPRP